MYVQSWELTTAGDVTTKTLSIDTAGTKGIMAIPGNLLVGCVAVGSGGDSFKHHQLR
jgi:hypothetical protein